VRKRTNIILDRRLVSEAAAVLGTQGPTETVHAAMTEVVRSARRRRLAAWELSDLTLETLEEMRRPRLGG
jgi:Arc/MetJ family transcription regulator